MKKLGMPTKATIIATIVFFLGLLNGVLTMLGKPLIDIGEAEVGQVYEATEQLISVVWLVISSLIVWWRNMSFTKPAIRADEALHTGAFDTEDPQIEEEYNA